MRNQSEERASISKRENPRKAGKNNRRCSRRRRRRRCCAVVFTGIVVLEAVGAVLVVVHLEGVGAVGVLVVLDQAAEEDDEGDLQRDQVRNVASVRHEVLQRHAVSTVLPVWRPLTGRPSRRSSFYIEIPQTRNKNKNEKKNKPIRPTGGGASRVRRHRFGNVATSHNTPEPFPLKRRTGCRKSRNKKKQKKGRSIERLSAILFGGLLPSFTEFFFVLPTNRPTTRPYRSFVIKKTNKICSRSRASGLHYRVYFGDFLEFPALHQIRQPINDCGARTDTLVSCFFFSFASRKNVS